MHKCLLLPHRETLDVTIDLHGERGAQCSQCNNETYGLWFDIDPCGIYVICRNAIFGKLIENVIQIRQNLASHSYVSLGKSQQAEGAINYLRRQEK